MDIKGLASSIAGANTDLKTDPTYLLKLKAGKTPEQKKVIDFFNPLIKSGCLSSGKLMKTISMQEYISMVKRKAGSYNLKQMAIDKIGLPESQINEIEPMVLSSFIYDSGTMIKYEEGMCVSNKYSITWIFFGNTQMFTYKFIFDMTSDEVAEYTNDFFYADITRIGTGRVETEHFEVKPASGCLGKPGLDKYIYIEDKFNITVPGFDYYASMVHNPALDQSIQNAKTLIRDKKNLQ